MHARPLGRGDFDGTVAGFPVIAYRTSLLLVATK